MKAKFLPIPDLGQRLGHLAALALSLGLMLMLARPLLALEVRVEPDKAALLKVAGQPATVIVGNPLYANVRVMDKRLIIQGRHKGKTNVIVLDIDGRELARFDIVVSGEPEDQVAMYLGGARITYLCKPDCAPMLSSDTSTKVLEDLSRRMRVKDDTVRSSVR